MSDPNELRRRASNLIATPPYERPAVSDLRTRVAARRRRHYSATIAVGCAVALGAALLVSLPDRKQSRVTIATGTSSTTVSPSVIAVDPTTTIADLRFTPIENPAGTTSSASFGIFALEDRFVAIDDNQAAKRMWERTSTSGWRSVRAAPDLAGLSINSVETIGGKIIVQGYRSGTSPAYNVILTGRTLSELRVDPLTTQLRQLPTKPIAGTPKGRWVIASAIAETTAFGERGALAVGRTVAQLNSKLLPQEVQAILQLPFRHQLGVSDGYVTITDISGNNRQLFRRRGSELGITEAELDFLSQSYEKRTRLDVWASTWAQPFQQVELVGLPSSFRDYGDFTAVANDHGYTLMGALSSGSAIWSSSDGAAWHEVTARAPIAAEARFVQLGNRWVSGNGGPVLLSDDAGRTWRNPVTPIDSDLGDGAAKFSGVLGANGFGILGSGSSLSTDLQTAFPGRIGYSPTGDVWTSVPFSEVGIAPSVPSIVVNSQGAIISVFVPGQPLKLILVTLATKR